MASPQFAVLSLTEAAAARARKLIASAGQPVVGLRVGVRNGGCAGMAYTMKFADEIQAAEEVIEDQGVKILIAPKDLMFLLGTRLDFEADTLQASFTFQNPNQTGACGWANRFRSRRPTIRARPFNPVRESWGNPR